MSTYTHEEAARVKEAVQVIVRIVFAIVVAVLLLTAASGEPDPLAPTCSEEPGACGAGHGPLQ